VAFGQGRNAWEGEEVTIGTLGADLLIVFSLTLCSVINVIILAVLVKHLHWLWIRKREDMIEMSHYIADKIKKDLTQ
jgi:hypothetical protein